MQLESLELALGIVAIALVLINYKLSRTVRESQEAFARFAITLVAQNKAQSAGEAVAVAADMVTLSNPPLSEAPSAVAPARGVKLPGGNGSIEFMDPLGGEQLEEVPEDRIIR